MAELKTKKNAASVKEFLKRVPDEQRRRDSLVLLKMFTDITGQPAAMWGSAIVGFGMYHYESERSSQKGDWPLIGFSPRKQNLTLYLSLQAPKVRALLPKLGRSSTSKACLYIKKLADIHPDILEKIIDESYRYAKKTLNVVYG